MNMKTKNKEEYYGALINRYWPIAPILKGASLEKNEEMPTKEHCRLTTSAYGKICNAIKHCLNDKEKLAADGMYLFLHLDHPEDSSLHIDLVKNVPSGTDIGQHA